MKPLQLLISLVLGMIGFAMILSSLKETTVSAVVTLAIGAILLAMGLINLYIYLKNLLIKAGDK